jgi:hypothetical protein
LQTTRVLSFHVHRICQKFSPNILLCILLNNTLFQALSQAKALQKEVDLLQGSPYLHGLRRVSELKTLSLPTLKSLQAQLRSDLEEIEKVQQ